VFDELCESCDMESMFCELIDLMLEDIKHLESEAVRARHELSRYVPSPYDEFLRWDVFSDLSSRYNHKPAYLIYTELYHNGMDPMDSPEWTKQLLKLGRNGSWWPWHSA